MKKALVTGANGFVGSALVRELTSNNIDVIAVVRKNKGNLPDNVRVITCELKDIKKLSELVYDRDIDVVYHLAWEGVSGALRSSISVQLDNIKGTIDCLYAAHEMKIKRFICAGSIMENEALYVTDSQGNIPGDIYIAGSGIYGSCKYAAHALAISIAADLGIDLVWTRITNTYGAGEISQRFLGTTLRKIINDEPLRFTAATQNYDFVYVDDVARAFRLIAENGRSFCCYNIGGSDAKPLKEYILEIKRTLAPNKEFIFGDIPFTGANLPLSEYDCTFTENDTGFKAEIPFSEGIRRTMEWLKNIK